LGITAIRSEMGKNWHADKMTKHNLLMNQTGLKTARLVIREFGKGIRRY